MIFFMTINTKIRLLVSMFFITLTNFIYCQNNPTQINISTPLAVPSDETKRALNSIKLLDGFKYGSGSNGSRLTLQISGYPAYVENGYENPPSNCGLDPQPNNSLVGEIEGNFAVLPSGSATYQIPIKLSPGTAGMQPNLSVSYMSGAGSGIMGLGWNLSGLSAITRGNKNPYLDNKYEAISMSLNDVFNIDGNRLLLKSGTYGINGSTYDTESISYINVTANGSQGFGPQSFTVIDKNGTITEYGNTSDSRLTGVNDNTPLAWFVNKITDEFGNYMTLEYQQLDGETVIKSIKYTGNTNAGLHPYNEIVFEYQAKTEKNTIYIGGKQFKSTQLLKSITALANNQLVKKYTFDYIFSFNTLLSAVHEINQDGTEVNPTEFCWSDPNNSNPGNNAYNSNLYSGADASTKYNQIKQTFPVDFDGDGFSDLLIYQNNNKYEVLHNQYRANIGTSSPIDFASQYNAVNPIQSSEILFSTSLDADFSGKQSVYNIVNDQNSPTRYHIQEIKNNNSSYVPSANVGNLSISVSTIHSINSTSAINTLLLPSRFYYDKNDYTADAEIDELIIDHEKVVLNSTSGNTIYTYNAVNTIVRPCDFDGDGSLELFVFKNNTTSLAIDVIKYNAGAFSIIHSYSIPFAGNVSANLLKLISIGDYNGDGNTDVLYLNQTKQNMYICYSNSKEFLAPKLISTFEALSPSKEYNLSSVDINGDAISDIIITTSFEPNNPDNYITYYSVGDLFLKGFSTQGKLDYFTYQTLKFTKTRAGLFAELVDNIGTNYHLSADFNGDGIYDAISIDNLNTKIILNNALSNKQQYISNIRTALSKSIRVTYANTATHFDNTKTLVYNPYIGQPLTQPIISINPNKYVVSETASSNANLTNLSRYFRYVYGHALFHSKGKGFLGFSSFTEINTGVKHGTQTSFTLNTNYFVPQTTESIGAVFFTQTNLGITHWLYNPLVPNTMSLQQTTNFVTPISSKQFFLAPSTITQKNYLNSVASVSHLMYDLNQKGNVISSNTTYGWEGEPVIKTEQTNYTYSNVNGILKPQSVTATSTQNGEASYSRTNEFTYDGAGHLTSTISDPTFGNQSLITTYQDFNAFGAPTKATVSAGDILPRTSQTIYEPTGRFVIKTINPKGDVQEFEYETKYGNLIKSKDITGLLSNFYYDGFGRLIKTKLPDNTVNTIEYKWTAQPNANSTYHKIIKNQGEAYSTVYYNYLGQVASTETIDFNGNTIVTENKYNFITLQLEESSEPHFATQTDNYLVTKYTYDAFLRPLKTELFKKTANGSFTTKNIFSNYSYNVPSIDFANSTQYRKGFVRLTDQTNKSIYKENNAAAQQIITKNTDNTGVTQTSTYEFISNGNPKNCKLSFSNIADVITHGFTYNNLGQQTQLIDPSAGTINYQYNTLGELLQQSEANGTWTYTYDNIGRVLSRTGSASGTTTYQYVTGNNGKNRLEKITGPNVTTEYTYDYLSRLTSTKETVNSTGKVFTSNTQYDALSRVSQQTHVGGYITKYEYANTGELTAIKNSANQLLWQLNNQNALGQITDYTYGNGINTTKVFNDLHQLNEVNHGGIHTQLYAFDPLAGNLMQRDVINNLTNTHNREKFNYDALDRLNQAKQTDPANMDAQLYVNNTSIDIKGNITSKTDAGDFLYNDPNKPYQLTQINNPTPNIPTNALSTTINDLRKVNQITEATTHKEMNFMYGNDDERIKVDYLVNGVKQYTRYYQTNYDYQEDATGANTKEWTYLYAPTGLLAVYHKQNAAGQLLYTLTDHLGSPLLLTNQSQNIVHEQSFDAWGRRRNPVDWSYGSLPSGGLGWARGYTLHEHIDEFNLINMNGRVYDPILGRFLQPDNQVQYPDYIQSFNKYAYVFNNPLSFTDPSGWAGESGNDDLWDSGGMGLSPAYSNYGDVGNQPDNIFAFITPGGGNGGANVYSSSLSRYNQMMSEASSSGFRKSRINLPRIHLDLRARYSNYKTRNGKTWEFGSTRPFDSDFLEFSFSHGQTDIGSSIFNGGLPSDMGGGDDPPTKPQRGGGSGDAPFVYNKSPEQLMKEMGVPQSGRIDQDYTFEKLFIPFNILKSSIFNAFSSASKGLTNTVTRSESVLGHIFRNAPGHVNPSTVASQNRYIKLFESVANNPSNLNQNILAPNAIKNGVQGFTQTFKNGQIWVHTRNGKIFDAGVNLIPR